MKLIIIKFRYLICCISVMYRIVYCQQGHDDDDQKYANCNAKAKEMGNKLTKNFCGIYCKLPKGSPAQNKFVNCVDEQSTAYGYGKSCIKNNTLKTVVGNLCYGENDKSIKNAITKQQHDPKDVYNTFGIIVSVQRVSVACDFKEITIRDRSTVEATVKLKLTEKNYPKWAIGDIIRIHRCYAKFYNGKLELTLPKPENIVIYPRYDRRNPRSVANKPTFHTSDQVIIKALLSVNIQQNIPITQPQSSQAPTSTSTSQINTLSNIKCDGNIVEIVCQMIGFHELNSKKGCFAFVWDGTNCKVPNLKKHVLMELDDPLNKKKCDEVLFQRAKKYIHHFFIFDNIANKITELEPGVFIHLTGVKISILKRTQELYLACKGSVKVLAGNHTHSIKLRNRFAALESSSSEDEAETRQRGNRDNIPYRPNTSDIGIQVESPTKSTVDCGIQAKDFTFGSQTLPKPRATDQTEADPAWNLTENAATNILNCLNRLKDSESNQAKKYSTPSKQDLNTNKNTQSSENVLKNPNSETGSVISKSIIRPVLECPKNPLTLLLTNAMAPSTGKKETNAKQLSNETEGSLSSEFIKRVNLDEAIDSPPINVNILPKNTYVSHRQETIKGSKIILTKTSVKLTQKSQTNMEQDNRTSNSGEPLTSKRVSLVLESQGQEDSLKCLTPPLNINIIAPEPANLIQEQACTERPKTTSYPRNQTSSETPEVGAFSQEKTSFKTPKLATSSEDGSRSMTAKTCNNFEELTNSRSIMPMTIEFSSIKSEPNASSTDQTSLISHKTTSLFGDQITRMTPKPAYCHDQTSPTTPKSVPFTETQSNQTTININNSSGNLTQLKWKEFEEPTTNETPSDQCFIEANSEFTTSKFIDFDSTKSTSNQSSDVIFKNYASNKEDGPVITNVISLAQVFKMPAIPKLKKKYPREINLALTPCSIVLEKLPIQITQVYMAGINSGNSDSSDSMSSSPPQQSTDLSGSLSDSGSVTSDSLAKVEPSFASEDLVLSGIRSINILQPRVIWSAKNQNKLTDNSDNLEPLPSTSAQAPDENTRLQSLDMSPESANSQLKPKLQSSKADTSQSKTKKLSKKDRDDLYMGYLNAKQLEKNPQSKTMKISKKDRDDLYIGYLNAKQLGKNPHLMRSTIRRKTFSKSLGGMYRPIQISGEESSAEERMAPSQPRKKLKLIIEKLVEKVPNENLNIRRSSTSDMEIFETAATSNTKPVVEEVNLESSSSSSCKVSWSNTREKKQWAVWHKKPSNLSSFSQFSLLTELTEPIIVGEDNVRELADEKDESEALDVEPVIDIVNDDEVQKIIDLSSDSQPTSQQTNSPHHLIPAPGDNEFSTITFLDSSDDDELVKKIVEQSPDSQPAASHIQFPRISDSHKPNIVTLSPNTNPKKNEVNSQYSLIEPSSTQVSHRDDEVRDIEKSPDSQSTTHKAKLPAPSRIQSLRSSVQISHSPKVVIQSLDITKMRKQISPPYFTVPNFSEDTKSPVEVNPLSFCTSIRWRNKKQQNNLFHMAKCGIEDETDDNITNSQVKDGPSTDIQKMNNAKKVGPLKATKQSTSKCSSLMESKAVPGASCCNLTTKSDHNYVSIKLRTKLVERNKFKKHDGKLNSFKTTGSQKEKLSDSEDEDTIWFTNMKSSKRTKRPRKAKSQTIYKKITRLQTKSLKEGTNKVSREKLSSSVAKLKKPMKRPPGRPRKVSESEIEHKTNLTEVIANSRKNTRSGNKKFNPDKDCQDLNNPIPGPSHYQGKKKN